MKKSNVYLSFSSAEFLLRDAVRLLEMGKKISPKPKKVIDLKIRGSYVRSSILLFDSSVEAILNHLLENIAFNELSGSLKGKIARLPYKMKLLEVVGHSIKFSKEIKNDKLFVKLQELHTLRNSFVHPQDLKYPVDMVMGKDKKGKELLRMNIHNKKDRFPASKMQKIFMYIDYQDGKIAKDIVGNFLRWLDRNLSKNDREILFNLKIIQTTPKRCDHRAGKIDWKVGEEIKMMLSGKGEDLMDFPIFTKEKNNL